MSERMLRRWIFGTVVGTCLGLMLAISATPVAAADTKWRVPDASQVSVVSEPRDGEPLSLSPFAAAPKSAPAAESTLVAGCTVTALPNDGGTSGNERAPNLRNRFGRSVYLILASEMAAAGIAPGTSFSQIGWSFQTAPGLSGSGPLIVYMENTGDLTNNKSTTWATAITGMTIVHNAATTIPNVVGPWDINLSAGGAFTYTGGGLYVAFDAQYPVGTLSGTTVVWCNAAGLVNGLKGAQGATAPTTIAASSFRPETRLTPSVATILNDASVDFVMSYGALPRDLVGPQTVRAVVSNRGVNALTNLSVKLTVSGANSYSNTQIVPSLAACTGSAVVTFAPYTASALGNDTATVTVPADDTAANNSKGVPVAVTVPRYSYKYPGTTASGGVGVANSTATLVGKFTTTFATSVTDVTLEFFAASTTTYRVALYGDSGGTPGALLYLDASDRTVSVAGPVTITLPGPVGVGPGNFYAGIQQTNTINASLSFDNEVPIRTGSFFGAIPIGGAWFDFAPGNNFKFNVGVIVAPCSGGPAVCDDGNLCTDDSCDPVGGCVHVQRNCDDGQICTDDSCNPATGQCVHTPVSCNDGNPCTDDSCIQALTAFTPPCTVPDNGGTVTLPPAGCDYLSPSDVHEIINGLPPGTTIELTGIHRDFVCGGTQGTPPAACDFVPSPACEQPGGALGGQEECADSTLQLSLHGTGSLNGWNRVINLPVSFETHVGPRTPGQPIQSFPTDMFRLMGQLPAGDPDFDLLRISAGTAFGMPSPGHTTLRQIGGGNWAVDSFFDITYRIDFIGHNGPGGHIGGMSGSTTGTIRMQTGSGVGCVHNPINCDDGDPCTLDSCDQATGQCTHASCDDGNACTVDSCSPDTGCVHAIVNCDDGQICTSDSCDPVSGCVHSPLNCDDGNACTVDGCAQAFLTPPCTVPDNGGGTVTLPPAGCDYLSPQDVHEIINGLPAGTTIKLGAIHRDFICHSQPGSGVCSFSNPVPGDCDQPGGALGGEKECSDSSLTLQLQGTGGLGGWNRSVQLPISFETHTAPRLPGQPVQSFDTQMFRLQGQLPAGDPDFDLLRITAGNDFGLPSPGHTTLTQLPGGSWKVDSFFDITYRIDFIGHPGGHIGGMSGSTTGTIRMQTGSGVGCTHSALDCNDSNVCTDDSCDPTKGCIHAPHSCDDSDPCTNDSCVQAFVSNPCTVTATGGTVVLPPAGCSYLSPQEVHEILNGLPAGTSVEFGAIHRDFICHPRGAATPPDACDPVFNNVCRTGTPGTGVDDCSDSQLELHLHGTGGLSIPDRTLLMPITFQTHQNPRTPGQPVQSFPADMSRLFGQLPPGDPDFDLLRITAGTLNGLPSPGHTTLTDLGNGSFKVDSFFDITYRIDYVGSAGGHLGGMSGSTTGTIRMATGTGVGCVHTPNPPPGQITALHESKSGSNVVIVDWEIIAPTYDVVRGRISALPVGPGGADELCMGNDIATNSLMDAFVPIPGQGVWYLVRGSNACGVGPYGNEGLHGVPAAPRNTTTCP